ncbi:hypothetical protein ACFV0Z_04330 [Streptomyces xiamenensis]|uniref:hypothetical protein n=1 Tax=Streptomyces xiamenensis TaxID=408015 RepID=UPI0036A67176
MVRARGTMLVVVLLVGALLGGGTGRGRAPWMCAVSGRPEGLTQQHLVGDYTGEPFGTLRLAADGTFTVTDWRNEIPWEQWDMSTRTREREQRRSREGHGKWALLGPGSRSGDLVLDFDQLDGMVEEGEGRYGRDMEIGGSISSPTIYQYLHDPDVCEFLTFTK